MMTTEPGSDGSLRYLDFLEFDQLFCEGESPESIEANIRENVEQRTEDLFNSLNSNLFQINAITNQWIKEAENLPYLGSSQDEALKDLEKSVEELRQQKSGLDSTFSLARKKLEEQKALRKDLSKTLESYQTLLKNIPDCDPREKALIEGGRIACTNLNTGKF